MFTDQEKKIAADAFNVYMQVVNSNAPASQVRAIAEIAKSVMQKIANPDASEKPQKLPGITEDQFENVCMTCESFKGGRCSDSVAIKFPGKCDPILKYERNKPDSGFTKGSSEE